MRMDLQEKSRSSRSRCAHSVLFFENYSKSVGGATKSVERSGTVLRGAGERNRTAVISLEGWDNSHYTTPAYGYLI